MTVRRVSALLIAAAIGAVALGNHSRAQDRPAGEIYLIAVGICPPYRTEIPVEVCRNGVDAVVKNFGEALGIDTANVVALTDGKATGPNFLKTVADLAPKLTADDRLIVFINGHGDAFSQWAAYYDHDPEITQINERTAAPDEYILVFWTEEEPTVPALALAEKKWLTVDDVIAAIDVLPARIALIIDSCSSNRAFAGIQRHVKHSDRIDYLATSAGAEQASNFNLAKTMPLFTEELVNALNLPTVRDFGEAMAHARLTTVLRATAICSSLIVDPRAFPVMFPGLSVPVQRTHDGKVAVPLWFCGQVPSVADFSGQMTRMPLYGQAPAE